MNNMPNKIILPKITITEVTDASCRDAMAIIIPQSEITPGGTYFIKPTVKFTEGFNNDGTPTKILRQFNFFPVVLDNIGVPWAEANVYILSQIESVTAPCMTTYASIAEDLSWYRKFLDEKEIDWMHFPSMKLSRPTYRYNGYLKYAVQAGEIAAASAKRRVGTVIQFYSWLRSEGAFIPANPPWIASDRYVSFKDSRGFENVRKIQTTDISIKTPQKHNPYDGKINDGEKLSPLPLSEQEWLMDALISKGNTEMTLIHLLGLLTGARIQTILTFRVRHVASELENITQSEVRVPIGPGTGIDSKYNVQMVLHIPSWFYQILRNYAHSIRAIKRRKKAPGGDHGNQYLFLSVRGTPLYQSKEDLFVYNDDNKLRHIKTGQAVRQFMSEEIIPFIREKYMVKDFHYRFHDTRATAGMNWTDHQLKLVGQGIISLMDAREFVRVRMGHRSSTTTDLYLNYRKNLKIVRWAGNEYENHIMKLSEQAMKGLI